MLCAGEGVPPGAAGGEEGKRPGLQDRETQPGENFHQQPAEHPGKQNFVTASIYFLSIKILETWRR